MDLGSSAFSLFLGDFAFEVSLNGESASLSSLKGLSSGGESESEDNVKAERVGACSTN